MLEVPPATAAVVHPLYLGEGRLLLQDNVALRLLACDNGTYPLHDPMPVCFSCGRRCREREAWSDAARL